MLGTEPAASETARADPSASDLRQRAPDPHPRTQRQQPTELTPAPSPYAGEQMSRGFGVTGGRVRGTAGLQRKYLTKESATTGDSMNAAWPSWRPSKIERSLAPSVTDARGRRR